MEFESNKSLQKHNTFGIDVICRHFQIFETIDDLKSLFSSQKLTSSPLLILGGGSNILFTKNFEGTVLKNKILGTKVIKEDEKNVFVKAGGGVVWHDFVLWCIKQGYGGIENMSLIPGSVGAAPMQNIGAYGVEIKDVFDSLEAFEIGTSEIKTFNAHECQFGYRESVFKRALKGQYIISSVTFKLTKTGYHKLNTSYGMIESNLQQKGISNPNIQDISKAVIEIRKSKLPDPAEIGNSGSFFKNPILLNTVIEKLKKEHPDLPVYPVDEYNSKTAAGWLIDQAGWKGYRDGEFGVHKNQALVLVNYGAAKGSDIYDFSEKIIKSIKEKFGVELEREVNIY